MLISLRVCAGDICAFVVHKQVLSWHDSINDKVKLRASFTLNLRKRTKDNKQCLSDTPSTVMVKEENYYQEYKGHVQNG